MLAVSCTIFSALLYVLGPSLQASIEGRPSYEPFLFPASTTALSIVLASAVLLLSLNLKIVREQLAAKIAIQMTSLASLQVLLTCNAMSTSRYRPLGIDLMFPMMLLCLVLRCVRVSKFSNALDLLGITLCSFVLSTREIPLALPPLYTQEALRRVFIEATCGVMLAFVLLSTASILTRSDIKTIPMSSPDPDSVEESDLQNQTNSDSQVRRLVIVLLAPQILVSMILVAYLDGFYLSEVRLLPMLIASIINASSVFFLVGYMLSVRRSVDTSASCAALALIIALRKMFDYDLALHQLMACACICVMSYSCMQKIKLPVRRIFCLVFLLFCIAKVAHMSAGTLSGHPLHTLLRTSGDRILAFEKREREILTFDNAVEDYISRYNRIPPPGFKKWFEYAKQHDTLILSNFDQIERDLGPFWSVRPSEIRRRTYVAIQDRYNFISPLRIRNGTVSAPPMEIPTHYWMLERLMEMMTDFVEFLPDMDIAINLNDEPRVLARTHRAPQYNPSRLRDISSTLTPEHWKTEIPFTDAPPESFRKVERENRNTYDYSTRFCPRRSLAKAYFYHAQFRNDQAVFLQDWQEALNICEQPQLRDSSGLFVSPSSYDATDELLPVFSQSKPSTFGDILLPSPWNFGDKVGQDTTDDVSWESKWDRVYWRGSTTEGWATSGTWRVMLRQRMVDLLGGAWDHAKSLVPEKAQIYAGNDSAGYVATEVRRQELYEFFDPDVFFVNIDRADEKDADDQRSHFRLQEPLEFKEHWKHKYLLDADGAAFSGRFLPFLQSHSVPLKLTSVFTEWWSDRVFAYQHFIPVTTENVFSTLAYFIGIKTAQGSLMSEAHEQEAQKIAEQGLRWSEKVLRKVDMKIYLWRLLLEYGRLVDDQRESLGEV